MTILLGESFEEYGLYSVHIPVEGAPGGAKSLKCVVTIRKVLYIVWNTDV